MKRIIIILCCTGLVWLFLTYAGVFRDPGDPVSVVQFYYQCMRNWEWFLTAPMMNAQTFSYAKEESDYIERKLFKLKGIKAKLRVKEVNKAKVSVLLFYKDGGTLGAVVDLVESDGGWLIDSVTYGSRVQS